MAYPANTCRAVFQFSLPNGSNGYVTPHFRKSDGGDYTQAELDGLVVQLADWFVNDDYNGETNQAWRDYMVDDCTLTSITCTGLAALAPPQAILPVNSAGAAAQLPLPNETSLVVTWYTGIVGRSYRGRSFWPGLPVTFMEANGTVNNGTLAGMQETMDALIAGTASGTSSELCVNSETLGLSTFVTSCVVRDTLHHQRRRNS